MEGLKKIINKNEAKVFCIGFNKTGTTSLEAVLKGFGYNIGDQTIGETLIKSWYHRDFKDIIKLSKTATAFQDVPYSLPYTYLFLDRYFKNAKFILTERDSAEQWYKSIVKYHSKLWSNGVKAPTTEQLKNGNYRYKGFAYDYMRFVYGEIVETNPYHKETLIEAYTNHNQSVKAYFESRPEKLLTINISNASDYGKLCAFLNKPQSREDFPWENKTTIL
ncbi:sulfotransferase [Oceanihabitans sp. 2_MG-2023]|uniref:sulfotransferase n=1 Tax=Oceanihabitans sp. 2_MG-2023 TaxID=3062661 RepID=UPI0026E3E5F4|nr:sulfotransferase [Oceanihabitans sp. 2_MG-2023]MDO6597679.1 sulfotransferase [Oceanihabitans sp. 2_MG-2023]